MAAGIRKRAWLRKLGWTEHKTLYLITLCSLMMNLLYAQVETTLPLHLKIHFADSRSVFAMMLTFNGLVVIALQMWIAGRSESLPSYAVMSAAFALYALVALGYGFAPWRFSSPSLEKLQMSMRKRHQSMSPGANNRLQ